MTIQKQLGKRIQKLRKIKGYSQEKFAEAIGIATTSLSYIETGNGFMTGATLDKIVDILEIKPQDLFNFDDAIYTDEMLYNEILNKIEFIKGDAKLLKIVHSFLKSIIWAIKKEPVGFQISRGKIE